MQTPGSHDPSIENETHDSKVKALNMNSLPLAPCSLLPFALALALAFQFINRFCPVRHLELIVDFVDVLLDSTDGDT